MKVQKVTGTVFTKGKSIYKIFDMFSDGSYYYARIDAEGNQIGKTLEGK